MSPEQANTWMATKQQWPTAQDCSRSPTQSAPGATPPSGGPTDPTRMMRKPVDHHQDCTPDSSLT